MKTRKKTYWKGLEQLTNDPEFVKYADKEFAEKLPLESDQPESEGSTRRDFLKIMGFSVAAASLAACEAPVRHAIPWLNKPVDVDPGIPNFYASTYALKGDFASIIIKTREGRPIKVEGNPDSKITQGGSSAQVLASVLSLYDEARLRGPILKGKETTWSEVDKTVKAGLAKAVNSGKKVAIVSNSLMSPSTNKVIKEFQNAVGNTDHIVYDAIAYDGILDAHNRKFGKRAIPSMHFDKAAVIVSFSADFLGTWVSNIEFAADYAKGRKMVDGHSSMSRHYQFEANLSLTGSNADYRGRVRPSQEGLAIAYLYDKVAKATGNASVGASKVTVDYLDKAAADLIKAKGKGLVVSGSNDINVQLLVAEINQMLGNYGATLSMENAYLNKEGSTASIKKFANSLSSYGAVIFLDSNPVYDSAFGKKIEAGLSKVALTVSTAQVLDETSKLCQVQAPDAHFMESWNDARPKENEYALCQPVISPLFDSRQAQSSLIAWSGGSDLDFFNHVKANWSNSVLAASSDVETAWTNALYNGGVSVEAVKEEKETELIVDQEQVEATASPVASIFRAIKSASKSTGFDIAFYPKIGIGDGYQANNPWLQELPDPVTKATWENYVTLSQKAASTLGVTQKEGNTGKVNVSVGGTSLEIPVLIQPGQEDNTIGIAYGYGRTDAGKVANEKGVNVYPLLKEVAGSIATYVTGAEVSNANKAYKIGRTQTHETFMGRDSIIQETTFKEFKKDPDSGRKHVEISTYNGKVEPETLSLWKGHDYNNHHWGLSIDLTACNGCSACMVGCQSENNVPVVGKKEILARREMHWLRIDRYYSSDAVENFADMEVASANPEVTYQPMMCQHCNNAPCETVCPVVATTHSSEGLNQMTYNRCIGTRYCANNCPYKVRRFNWFKYHDNKQFGENLAMNNNLGKMVLNPDVTVRSRGVMEKCSMCVQRIQYGKLEAKKEGRRPTDNDVSTACASACPTNAIVFGDMNDPKSEISKLLKQKKDQKDGTVVKMGNPRAYHVLEEINVRPNVAYLTKIRNKDEEKNENHTEA